MSRVHVNDTAIFLGYLCPVEEGGVFSPKEKVRIVSISGKHDNPHYLANSVKNPKAFDNILKGEFNVIERIAGSKPLKIRKPRTKKPKKEAK